MAKINLLPEDLLRSKPLTKIVALLKQITILVSGLFGLSAVVFIAILITLKLDLNKAEQRQEELKNEIRQLAATEQSLFFLKDRLTKIRSVQRLPVAPVSLVGDLNGLLVKNPGVTISQMKISAGEVGFLAHTPTSDGAGNFLEDLLQEISLTRVKLNSFSFSPNKGCLLDLEISK
jgi:hypothetical protein